MTRPGLRERKKQKTRSAIQREAMRLFQERGYDATTVEQIADAAEISPSTFFRYFPTKEDVVLLDDYDPMLVRIIAERPADEPVVTALRNALLEGMRIAFAEDEKLVRERLGFMLSVPAIRARMWEQTSSTVDTLCTAIATRTGQNPAGFEIRVAASTILGALSAAVMQWASEPDAQLVDLVTRALELVEGGLRL
jgi:AcrR family transcriptional regulator